MKGIAIDPGDRYTGVAFFDKDDDGVWECIDAQEFDPQEFELVLAETVLDATNTLEWVVFERFRLYADKAEQQKGSEFETAQTIGAIKFILAVNHRHIEQHRRADCAVDRVVILPCERAGQPHSVREPHRIELVGQMADIKKPTAGILRHKKIKSTAKPIARAEYGGRDHIVDAELHGYHHIMNTLGEEAR